MVKLLYAFLLALLIPAQTVWAEKVEIDLRKYKYDPAKGIVVIISQPNVMMKLSYEIREGMYRMLDSKNNLPYDDEFVIIGDPETTYKGSILVSGGDPTIPVKITIRDVKIKASEDLMERNAFRLSESRASGTHVQLRLEGENYLEGTKGTMRGDKMLDQIIGGAGIAVGYARKYGGNAEWNEYDESKSRCSIVIDGPGELTAIGGLGCAGIGGSGGSMGITYAYNAKEDWRQGHYCGSITINGGTIKAYGDAAAAAIGDSYNGKKSEIIINGGDITAKPLPRDQRHDVEYLAVGITGIGGGTWDRGFEVFITGGKITASGYLSPAIGGGYISQSGGTRRISISGDPVLELEGTYSPAIGLGPTAGELTMPIYISGGTIVAKGGAQSAAIGLTGIRAGGKKSEAKIYINISGGNLTLKGGSYAPAIGRPSSTIAPDIVISGNAQIDATGGYQAAGIGDGPYESGTDILLFDKAFTNVTISGNPTITAKGGGLAAGIGGGYNAVNGKITIKGGDITAIGGTYINKVGALQRSGAGIGSGGIHLGEKEANTYKEPKEIRIEGGNIVARGGYLAAGIGGGGGFGAGNRSAIHTIYFTGGTVKASGYRVAGVGDGLGIHLNSSSGAYEMISYDDYFNNDGLAKVYITGGNLIFNSYLRTDDNGNPTDFEAKDIKAAQDFPQNNVEKKSVYRTVVALLDKSGEWAAGKELKRTYKIPYNVDGITTGLAGEFFCYLPSINGSPGSVFDTNDSEYEGDYQISSQKEKLNKVFLREGRKLVIGAYGKDIHIYKDGFKLADRGDNLEKLPYYYLFSKEEYLIIGSDNQDTYIHIHEDYDGYKEGGSVKLKQYASTSNNVSAIIAEASVKLKMDGDVTLATTDGNTPVIHVTKKATVEISGDGCLTATGRWKAPAILAEGESQIKIKSGMLRLKGGVNAPAVKSDTTVTIDGGSIRAQHGSGSSTGAWEVAGLVNSEGDSLKEVILKIPGNGVTIDMETGYKYIHRPQWSSLLDDNQEEISGIYGSDSVKVLSFTSSPSTKSADAAIPRYNVEGIRLAEMETQNLTYLYPQYLYLPKDILPTGNNTCRIVVGIGDKQHENTVESDGSSHTLYPLVDYTVDLHGNTLSQNIEQTGKLGYNTSFLPLPAKNAEGDDLLWFTDKEMTRQWTDASRVNMENGVVASIGESGYKCSITFHAIPENSIEGSKLTMESFAPISYDGKEHTPSFTLKDRKGNDLEENIDYKVSYNENKNASDKAEIIVTGAGEYTGQAIFYFTIHRKELTLVNATVKEKRQHDNEVGEIDDKGNLVGVVDGDKVDVDWSEAIIEFNSTADIGDNIPVTLSGLTLTGAAKDNYELPQPIDLEGKVLAKPEPTPPPLPPLPPAEETWYILTIKGFDGLVTSPAAGSYSVVEGSSFTVHFNLPEGYVESDLRVMLDESEIDFRHVNGNLYAVTLGNVISDACLSIDKQAVFTIEIPEVTGVVTDPSAGIYPVGRFDSFPLRVTLEDDYDQSEVSVRVNGEELPPLALRSAVYDYRIDSIGKDLQIEILNVCRNDAVANETIDSDRPHIYTYRGTLYVELFREAPVTIHATSGLPVVVRRLSAGVHRFSLPAGVYIVTADKEGWKVRMPGSN